MGKETTESYIKAIYEAGEDGTPATTLELAKMLRVTPASVTEMLVKLAKQGHIRYVPYKGASLTGKGRRQGEELIRKDRLLEAFLTTVLALDKTEAATAACKMEHWLSAKGAKNLCKFLKHPRTSPITGKRIPPCTK
ncbi:MAG: metal-dependent transcriptional regulator [Candidatus Burarchaeum sp.]|nr:metal-dependent transcriptional regulator [Candidatus Burarchaeum sp.]MDO8339862.1 metal-dependent transcriptional regulator [Candidatus Burarchaeum sp.]